MASTSFGYPFPENTDEVDVVQDIADLAAAANARAYRAYPCTSTTRPTLLSGDRGFLADESDTGNLVRWNGTTWVVVGAGGGGGGGGGDGSLFGGRWKASSSQNIPATTSGPGSPMKFETDPSPAPSGVTKAVLDTGHVFTLTAAALWTGVLFGRFAANPATGVRDFAVYVDRAGGTNFAEALTSPMPQTVAGQAKGGPYSFCRYLPAGTKLVCYAYNGTGSGRALEHNGGEWVALDLWGR